MHCDRKSDNNLSCNANFHLEYLEDLKNLTKILYVNGRTTNLTITINKPETLKLFDYFSDYEFYSYAANELHFEVNYIELYNSSVSIKLGDIPITKCDKSKIYNDLVCKQEIPEIYSGKTLNLIFNGVETDINIEIKFPGTFSKIEGLTEKITYYSRSSSQFVYFFADSPYNMNNHKIELVSLTSGNKNITLNECTYDEYCITNAKCSGILDTNDVYYLYVDGINSEEKLYVYPEPTAISKVNGYRFPNNYLASSSETTFSLAVNYIVNIENAVFTLVDEYNSTNKFYLKNCSKIDYKYLMLNDITCVGKVTNPGYYYVYLNGVKQDAPIYVYSSSLTKAFYVEPNQIKFVSAKEIESFEIFFDSFNNIEQKSIILKGENNKKEINLTIDYIEDFSAEFDVIFPAEDLYRQCKTKCIYRSQK